MSPPRFRIRTMMIAIALWAATLALIVVVLRGLHFHSFYLKFG